MYTEGYSLYEYAYNEYAYSDYVYGILFIYSVIYWAPLSLQVDQQPFTCIKR